MITLAVLLTLCADVTVTRSITITSDASIERLACEAATELLPVAVAALGERRASARPVLQPGIRDAWLAASWPAQLRYGYTATLADRLVSRTTTWQPHHLRSSATLLSGLPQYCRSATLTLDAAETPGGRTRLVLSLSLRLDHPADWCRLVRRGMWRTGTAEADNKLQAIAAAVAARDREGVRRMDAQQQAFLRVLNQSVDVIQQARAEQGWTAGAVALILLACIVGLAWMVRRLVGQVDELTYWRTNVLQDQVQDTTRALTKAATGMERFTARVDDATEAVNHNTQAVHSLRDAIQHAPCGMRLTTP